MNMNMNMNAHGVTFLPASHTDRALADIAEQLRIANLIRYAEAFPMDHLNTEARRQLRAALFGVCDDEEALR